MTMFMGSGVAIVTPMKEGQVDFEALTRLLEWHVKEGTDAMVVTGTTGESATLSREEKLAIFRHAVAVVGGRIPVIAGTGSNNTQETLALSVDAQATGVDGLLLVTPYYNKPSQRGLYAHYKAVAEAVSIPIILYNVPSRTAVDLLPETVLALSKLKNIAAIKEATGDLSRVKLLKAGAPEDFRIYSGNDDDIVALMEAGGHGVISVLANVVPKAVHQMTADVLEGRLDAAREAQAHFLPLFKALFSDTNPVPAKAALNLMGWNAGELRLPLVGMEPEAEAALKVVLERFGLLPEAP